MSIFGKIKDAIFGKKSAPAPAPSPTSGGTLQPPPSSGAATTSPASQTSQPQPQSQVDVEQVLTGIESSKSNPDLNWRTSIVDLMKLLGIDSSLDNRKELARELGYTGELNGSAEMNIWLHKATMKQLAQHGGKVPASMLD